MMNVTIFARYFKGIILGVMSWAVCAGVADPFEAALTRAGENRSELEQFVETSTEAHGELGQRAAQFLVTYMPERDLTSLDAVFLSEHLNLALKARQEFAWAAKIPEEIYFNNVLPYASLDETRERWRPGLYEKTKVIVRGASSISEAVQAINRELFNVIDVHYNTGRKRPNQSPGESIEQGRATCTGLSIILVDACRSVGIPARVTGTPLWTNDRGNHTWTEIWDGDWFFTGSDEYDAKGLNRGWFVGDASKAIKSEPKYAIYSTSWKYADGHFPMVWNQADQTVNAFNETDRYNQFAAPKKSEHELLVRVRERSGGERMEVNAELLDEMNQLVAGVLTKAGRADMNDIASLSCKPDQLMWLRLKKGEQTKQIPIRRSGEGTVTLDLAWDSLPNADALQHSQLAQVKAWLAVPGAVRPANLPKGTSDGELSRGDAEEVIALLWGDLKRQQHEERLAELEARVITLGEHDLRFKEKVFGEAPASGASLWISMHGGGGAPTRVNDRQWENQIKLYQPTEGIYVAPRAPTDTWNLWHQGHIDPLFQRLIENYVITRGVDPARVYLMGYSAGGDGVFQLAPRMADRFAAVAMMAGHPNETQPIGLRNLPFALFMGGDDKAYQRNEKAAEWKDALAGLQTADPDGYPHWVQIYPGKGHWMDREDAEALPWMAARKRSAWPKRIEWLQDDITHRRFYWLSVSAAHEKPRQHVSASVDGQTIDVIGRGLTEIRLRLSDRLLDLDLPIIVRHEGRTVFEGKVLRSVRAIHESLTERADPETVASAILVVALTDE